MGYEKFKRPILAPGFQESATTPNPLGGIQSTELAPHVLRTAVVTLSAAQLEAMFATPVSILPAPGAGFAIIVKEIEFELIGGSVSFTGGGAITFPYHGSGTASHTGSIPTSGVNVSPSTTTITELGQLAGSNGTVIPANTGVDITNATAAFASGNGTAKVFMEYRIIQL
jgi:hypothetical protein